MIYRLNALPGDSLLKAATWWVGSGLLGLCILWVAYAQPYARSLDVGAGPGSIQGFTPDESNNAFSFAYTTAEAQVVVPNIGNHAALVRIRMGGPDGSIPVNTQLAISNQPPIALTEVQALRTYAFLTPTDQLGAVSLVFRPTLVTLPDNRLVGVLVDQVELRTLEPRIVAPYLAYAYIAVLALCWVAIRQLRLPQPGFAVLLCAALLSAAAILVRGQPLSLPVGVALFSLLNLIVALQILRFKPETITRPWLAIGGLFVVWRLAVFVVGLIGSLLRDQLSAVGTVLSLQDARNIRLDGTPLYELLIGNWVHWDGFHYISIVEQGYSFSGPTPTIAFFPLYPIKMYLLTLINGDSALSGLIISNVMLLIGLIVLYQLLVLDFDASVAFKVIILLLLFPTSLFFLTVYSESTALVLFAGTLYAVRRQKWWLAGLLCAALTLTRLPGIMLVPLIAGFYFQSLGWNWRKLRLSALALLLPPLALGGFMLWQWTVGGEPLAFMRVQEAWLQRMSWPWETVQFWFESLDRSWPLPISLFQASFYFLFVALMLLSVKRLPAMYTLATLLILVPPYLSNRIISFPRYALLGILVLTVLVLKHEVRRPYQLAVLIFCPLLSGAILLFVNGFWIA